MEETPNKSKTGSGYNTEHFKENSNNGNDEHNEHKVIMTAGSIVTMTTRMM